jgi:hypothetical protein
LQPGRHEALALCVNTQTEAHLMELLAAVLMGNFGHQFMLALAGPRAGPQRILRNVGRRKDSSGGVMHDMESH